MYLMLPIIFTAIRRTEDIRHLIWWWAAAASAERFVEFRPVLDERDKTRSHRTAISIWSTSATGSRV